jgi:hypothetical protein
MSSRNLSNDRPAVDVTLPNQPLQSAIHSMRIAVRVVVSVAIIVLVFGALFALLIRIPNTPHWRSMQHAASIQSNHEAGNVDAANHAFDEWLRLADQAQWVDAMVFPPVAAALILLVWRTQPLSAIECGLVVMGFVMLMTWRQGSMQFDRRFAISVLLFAVVLGGRNAWSAVRRLQD